MENKILAPVQPACAATGKAPYAKPELRVFGAVKTLTKGQAGSGTDSAGKSETPPGLIKK
jgi:hypothetical protein